VKAFPVDKTPVEDPDIDIVNADKLDDRYRVFAGSINGGEALEIKVSKIAADSTIARLVKLVNEAQTQKSSTQNFTDKLEKYYVPAVLILVTLLHFSFLIIDEPFNKSFYRAMAVLVAASPCALAISTPSAGTKWSGEGSKRWCIDKRRKAFGRIRIINGHRIR
jgi:Cd2+/Zn2+-exporting ATPase